MREVPIKFLVGILSRIKKRVARNSVATDLIGSGG